MRILVVAAHPDDEVLGVGGTVRRHADAGDEVHTLIACEGVTMRYGLGVGDRVDQHSRRAAERLGVHEVMFGKLPDQHLDTVPLAEVIGCVEQQVDEVRPDIVYTHCGGDVNRDHRVLLEAVQVAVRPYAAPWVREVLLFETPSSTEWGHGAMQSGFVPEVFVDISGTLEAKVAAFCCYEQEVRPEPHPRSPGALRSRASAWGSTVGLAAAEPFQVLRAIR